MIVSETWLNSTNASNDMFTAHRLLGPEILNHPTVSIIDFNPVAPTFIGKALSLIVQKEARQSGRRRIPGSSVLSKLCETGDIRSAIESLQFLCIRARDSNDWGGRVAANAKRGAKDPPKMTEMERESLEAVTQRDKHLGLFHSVGKVVYNKREEFALAPAEDSRKGTSIELPNDPLKHERSEPPKTSIDQLTYETGTDTETFIAALHENFVMSCEGPALMATLEGCLNGFSDSDLFGLSRYTRNGLRNSRGYGLALECLRQDEIVFHLVVRGLLLALPDPVKRSGLPAIVHGRPGGRGDLYKMF